MIDEILDIGAGMFGLMTRPAAGNVRGPIIVLTNYGVAHRTGPYRVHVQLARRLAHAGWTTFRFDPPGIGDSMPDDPITPTDSMIMAFDALQKHVGIDEFVIFGVCLGADLAWNGALRDARVMGLFQVDGLARKGWWYWLAHNQRRLQRTPTEWVTAVQQRFARYRAKKSPEYRVYRDWPARGVERTQLHTLLERDVRVFSLYTGGITSYFLHPKQFASTFGGAAQDHRVRFEFWPECGHVFFLDTVRDRVIDALRDWCTAQFADSSLNVDNGGAHDKKISSAASSDSQAHDDGSRCASKVG